MTRTLERTPLTDDERRLCRALARCTYTPGSPDKRFARHLAAVADEPGGGLTERQREYLTRMAHRYRRQREYLTRMARRYRRQLGGEWTRWCLVQQGLTA